MNNVILVAHIHGHTDRHLRARANWPSDAICKPEWGRDARAIGNDRPLPFLNELLRAGLDSGRECILITNDDCSLAEDAFERVARHCQVFEFGCVRREKGHCGREAFFFLSSWLRQHISAMPDVIICIERWDLVIARWLRKFHGYTCTERNWTDDMFPVEIAPGLVRHESHPSYWATNPHSPASLHNLRLWKELA